jgi:hypothetical protein
MLLNSFVNVKIEGRQIPNSYRVQRQHYREGGRVFLMTETNTLNIVKSEPVWSDRDSVVLQLDVQPGEKLITSALAVAIDGMELRLPGQRPAGPPKQGTEDGKGKPGEQSR